MKMGIGEYSRLLHRVNELESLAILTLAQEIELAHLNTRLTAAELAGPQRGITANLEALTDDYAAVMAAGDLGGTEL